MPGIPNEIDHEGKYGDISFILSFFFKKKQKTKKKPYLPMVSIN